MDRVLFVASLCALAFLYGAATIQYRVFPFSLLNEAKLGLEAWAGMDRQNRRMPNAFSRFEPQAEPVPQARPLAADAGNEAVLVTGGPYQLMEHCPTWGCMAWITDRAGTILHAWEVDLDALWEGLSGIAGDVNRLSLYPVGMALRSNGALIVSFQGRETYPVHIGIAKFDRNGAIVWKRFDRSHHWIAIDADKRIYTPFSTPVSDFAVGDTAVDLDCRSGTSDIDGIRVLSAAGEPLREIPVLDAFLRSGRTGWFYNVRDGCNPVHLNSIALAPRSAAQAIPGAAEGDLLISLRETNTVALLDARTGELKYAHAGLTAAQHSPQFLPDGSVLVFDNLGGERALGGTRVVRLDLVTGETRTVFPTGREEDLLPVRTETAGHLDVSPDGRRALVSVTHQGRIVEIDVDTGAPLWVYENTHDIAPFLEASRLSRETTRARFATYGAYYVRNLDFLAEDS